MTSTGDFGDVIELLQTLIRNRCVNEGTETSGQEIRNAETLTAYLSDLKLDFLRFEPKPGRTSLVTRIPGSDPDAPSLCFMGHIDVVPVAEAGWTIDPFGAEIHDRKIWGRGAVDMLNQVAAQAGAFRRLAQSKFRPQGDLIFLALADEEAGGTWGAEWITTNRPEDVRCDYMLTEGGGFHLPTFGSKPTQPTIGVMVSEKGPVWRELAFTGKPGHASFPYGADNAVIKMAQAAAQLAEYQPPARIPATWAALVAQLPLDDSTRSQLTDPDEIHAAIETLSHTHPVEAAIFHAQTHNTYSPDVASGGNKINVIGAEAKLQIDTRILPGMTTADVDVEMREALGPLFEAATIDEFSTQAPTESSLDTPLWNVLSKAAHETYGPCTLAPWTTPFATDARFFRRLGTVAYGFTLHDQQMDLATWLTLFHGNDECVSIAAMENATQLYEHIARLMLS